MTARAALAIALALAASASRHAPADDLADAAARQLREAIEPSRDGGHLAALAALRQLHDPALRPVFRRLVNSESWPAQVHAVLGLAELEDPPAVDPWLVKQVLPEAREQLVAEILDGSLVPIEKMRELASWSGLEPMPKALLLAELHLLGDDLNDAELNALAKSDELRAAALASGLVAQLGDGGAMSRLTARLDELDRPARRARVLAVFDAARQYRLAALRDWVDAEVHRGGAGSQEVYWGVYTLLVLDRELGLRRWRELLGPAASFSRRARFGVLLLRLEEPPLDPSEYERLEGEEPLILAMVAAGRAVAGDSGSAPALTALVDLDHPATTEWTLHLCRTLALEEARPVLLHMLERTAEVSDVRTQRAGYAVKAAELLLERDPEYILERLAAAEDDGLVQQVILTALAGGHDPRIGEAAARIRRIGAGAADTLALLLTARYAGELDPADLVALGRVAAGGGRVSEPLRTQAAWIFLSLTGRSAAAVATMGG